MKLENSININTVSVGVSPLLPISQALLGQRGDYIAPPVSFDPMSFDEAWTVRGMANNSPTKDTLNNLTGNGNDLTLFGFNYAEGSGYENGYLQFDGVDDGAQTSPFNMGRRWTMVGEWELGNVPNPVVAGMHKPNQLYLYNNRFDGMTVYINSTVSSVPVYAKSLHAICSDGRMYDKDWNLIVLERTQNEFSSNSALQIGTRGTKFTPMKFKNLAFYKDRVLTKEQAELAYNTLQAL